MQHWVNYNYMDDDQPYTVYRGVCYISKHETEEEAEDEANRLEQNMINYIEEQKFAKEQREGLI